MSMVEIILRTKIQRIRVVSSALWSLTCWVQFIAVMDVDILKSVFNNLWRHLWWPQSSITIKKKCVIYLQTLSLKPQNISEKKEDWVRKLIAADVLYPTYKHEGFARVFLCTIPACQDWGPRTVETLKDSAEGINSRGGSLRPRLHGLHHSTYSRAR